MNMIPLLTQEEIKTSTSKQEREHVARIRDLAQEEERLIKSVNELRATEKTAALEEFADLRQLLDERKEELDIRENGIALAEAELKRSTEALSEKWAEYTRVASTQPAEAM